MSEVNGKKIIICDDDEGIVDVASMVLEEKGYTIHECLHSELIYDLVKDLTPDMILLDLWMPGLSGEEITKNLKGDKRTSKIPIVIISASKDAVRISQEAGADDVLCKPFDISDLENIVEKYSSSQH